MINKGEAFKIINEKYENFEGNALLLNIDKIKEQYEYIGLWYVKDGSDKTFITTEIYYSNEKNPIKPRDFNLELKENAFKQANRFELPKDFKWVWITTRIDNGKYCKMKTGSIKEGKLYITFKVIHNKAFGFDVVGKGMFKGGQADFFALGSEDMTDKIDYTDALMYLVLIKDYPPVDWGIDHSFIGIENLPIFAPTFKFVDNRKYSTWFNQNPLENIK